ncbi:11858_t:CDS:1, partial [Racocetra fulgida]
MEPYEMMEPYEIIEPYEIMESYGMIENDFDDYLGDFNHEVAESSGTSTETFSSTTIRSNIQTSSDFPTPSKSKNKGDKI